MSGCIAHIVPDFTFGNFWIGYCVSDTSPSFWGHFLSFCQNHKMFQVCLILSLPNHGTALYLKNYCYHQKMIFRNQDMGADCAHCYFSSLIVSRPSSWTDQKNMYMYTNVPIYIYTYFNSYLSLCVCVLFISSCLWFQFNMLGFILASPPVHL